MLPSTVLVNILSCLKRRDLDVLELVDRAYGAVIAAHEKHLPRRSLPLIFFNEGAVNLISLKDTMKHVLVTEMAPYLRRSVITKTLFKSLRASTWTEEMYQALLPCRDHFTAEAVCDFRSLSMFPPDILHRALTEVFVCDTFVFAAHTSQAMDELRRYSDEQDLAALPCVANCTNLEIAYFSDAFFDANGALEWLLGTHAPAVGVKRLSIKEIDKEYWDVFLSPFIVAIEQQFLHATSPASFTVELRYSGERTLGPDMGKTREYANSKTIERLELVVDTSTASLTKVAIHRKPAG